MGNSFKITDANAQKKLADGINEREGSGKMGKWWGVSSSVPNNIAALTIVLILVLNCIYTIVCMISPALAASFSISDMWKTTGSLITLCFGYLYGKAKQ